MSTLEITRKSAGPEGSTIAPEQQAPLAGKILLAPFMLEDYVDALEAHAALEDPENSQRIPWEQLRDKLGL
jgi:hypothetical protein